MKNKEPTPGQRDRTLAALLIDPSGQHCRHGRGRQRRCLRCSALNQRAWQPSRHRPICRGSMPCSTRHARSFCSWAGSRFGARDDSQTVDASGARGVDGFSGELSVLPFRRRQRWSRRFAHRGCEVRILAILCRTRFGIIAAVGRDDHGGPRDARIHQVTKWHCRCGLRADHRRLCTGCFTGWIGSCSGTRQSSDERSAGTWRVPLQNHCESSQCYNACEVEHELADSSLLC